MGEARYILERFKRLLPFMKAYLCLISFVSIVISCQTKKSEVELIVKKWQGKEILIPADGSFAYMVSVSKIRPIRRNDVVVFNFPYRPIRAVSRLVR